jgi:hypothetical protein
MLNLSVSPIAGPVDEENYAKKTQHIAKSVKTKLPAVSTELPLKQILTIAAAFVNIYFNRRPSTAAGRIFFFTEAPRRQHGASAKININISSCGVNTFFNRSSVPAAGSLIYSDFLSNSQREASVKFRMLT